jgi:hypothetical protein
MSLKQIDALFIDANVALGLGAHPEPSAAITGLQAC